MTNHIEIKKTSGLSLPHSFEILPLRKWSDRKKGGTFIGKVYQVSKNSWRWERYRDSLREPVHGKTTTKKQAIVRLISSHKSW